MMNATPYDARLRALEFAAGLQPTDAKALVDYASTIETYLSGSLRVSGGSPSLMTSETVRRELAK